MKTCHKCKVEKDDLDFSKSQLESKYGQCRSCVKQFYTVNKARKLEYQKSYYQINKDEIGIYKSEYWRENKDDLYEYKKKWRQEYSIILKRCDFHAVDYYTEECPICVSIRNKSYKKEHAEEIKKYAKLYGQKNKDKKNEYYRDRRKNDPEYNIRRIVSASVYSMIKSQGSSKGGSIINYLPFTIKELKKHLEKQFEPWMNWGNHGKYDATIWNDNDPATWTWQIDHIVPQSILPYVSMEDDNFKKCWTLKNLRPLSSKQNLLDGAHKIRHKTE